MKDSDLKISPPEPCGGQHVNPVYSRITVTHIPTGITASVDTERSQMRNLRIAKAMLEYGLLEAKWEDV